MTTNELKDKIDSLCQFIDGVDDLARELMEKTRILLDEANDLKDDLEKGLEDEGKD